MQQPAQLRGKFAHFWEGAGLTAQKDCVIISVKLDRKICAILDPSTLPDRIAQFLEGRLVPLQNCTISWGSCLACSWTKSGEIACEGGATSHHAQAGNLLENH